MVLIATVCLLTSVLVAQQSPMTTNSIDNLSPATKRTPAIQAVTSHSTMDTGLNADAAVDVDATSKYLAAIAQILVREDFAKLEQISAEARASKSRFSGGVWKLYMFYEAVAVPSTPDHDWNSHLQRLERWKSLYPESITARVSLAYAYDHYAYDARGTAYADNVPDDAWRLVAERTAIAMKILEEAATLKAKCPHWYVVMLDLILHQDGNRDEEMTVFQQAVAFEPLYYYSYRRRAQYLLPKWFGKDGETEQFATEMLAQVGDIEGSIVYFEIASEILHQCNCDTQLKRMYWTLIKRGHEAMQERYGVSLQKTNQFARMAIALRQPQDAAVAFQQLGDRWDPNVWSSKAFFDECKGWATRVSSYNNRVAELVASSKANMETAEGLQYVNQFTTAFRGRFAAQVKQCSDESNNDLRAFDLFLRLKEDGAVIESFNVPSTAVSNCLLTKINSPTSAPPPKPNYWVRVAIHFD
jgi:tetratricopeptide (TPR) repeat protein